MRGLDLLVKKETAKLSLGRQSGQNKKAIKKPRQATNSVRANKIPRKINSTKISHKDNSSKSYQAKEV
jgi:hypothetical protein